MEIMKIHSSCISILLSWCFPNVCKCTTSIKTKQNQIEQNDNEKENNDEAFAGERH